MFYWNKYIPNNQLRKGSRIGFKMVKLFPTCLDVDLYKKMPFE